MSTRLTPSIDKLVDALRVLPGIGPKSATRMALFLLERNQEKAAEIAIALGQALEKVRRCSCCQNFCEEELCRFCQDVRRDSTQLCVVESATDVVAIEQSHAYHGRYFVLMGHLSPIDGVGPKDIGIDKLQRLIAEGQISELILATSSTVEGEATAHYIAEIANQHALQVSRIAQGIPLGGELGMLDAGTLSHALQGRKALT